MSEPSDLSGGSERPPGLPDGADRSIRDRVEAAFDPELAASYGDAYLDAIVTTWRELSHGLRRTTLQITLLILVFVLLEGARSVQFDLGPLRLTNVSALLTLIPALVAILSYELVALELAQRVYSVAVSEVMRAVHRPVYEQDLEFLLAPATIHPMGGSGRDWEALHAGNGRLHETVARTDNLVWAAIVFGTFGFLVYSYLHLYADRHANAIAVSVSLAVALVFAARAWALVLDAPDWSDL